MHKIYSHENFYTKFESDLKKARFLVLIQSPFMTLKRVNKLRPVLKECIERAVKVCVFAQDIDSRYANNEEQKRKKEALEEASRCLLSIGVHVNLVSGIHEKLVLVDENIFWEGSLNPLSYRDTTERMTRWDSRHKVLGAIIMHGLDNCSHCLEYLYERVIANERERRLVLGRLICKKRQQMNISQAELSKRAQVEQSKISKIELGTYDCRLSTFLKLTMELNLHCRTLPWFMLPTVDSQLKSMMEIKKAQDLKP